MCCATKQPHAAAPDLVGEALQIGADAAENPRIHDLNDGARDKSGRELGILTRNLAALDRLRYHRTEDEVGVALPAVDPANVLVAHEDGIGYRQPVLVEAPEKKADHGAEPRLQPIPLAGALPQFLADLGEVAREEHPGQFLLRSE